MNLKKMLSQVCDDTTSLPRISFKIKNNTVVVCLKNCNPNNNKRLWIHGKLLDPVKMLLFFFF